LPKFIKAGRKTTDFWALGRRATVFYAGSVWCKGSSA
jgi:hypothetical protein